MRIIDELIPVVEHFKANGLRCFTPEYKHVEKNTYFYCVDESGNIGYLQLGQLGTWSTSTVHKPNSETGTGFRMQEDGIHPLSLDNLLKEAKSACSTNVPYWGKRYAESVKKYKSFDEFKKAKSALNYIEL